MGLPYAEQSIRRGSKGADHHHGHGAVVEEIEPGRDFEKPTVLRKKAHPPCSPREGHLLKQEESKQKGVVP